MPLHLHDWSTSSMIARNIALLLLLLPLLNFFPFAAAESEALGAQEVTTSSAELSPLMAHIQRLRDEEKRKGEEAKEEEEQKRGGFGDDGGDDDDDAVVTVLEDGEVLDGSTTTTATATTTTAATSVEILASMPLLPIIREVDEEDGAGTSTTIAYAEDMPVGSEIKEEGTAEKTAEDTTEPAATMEDEDNGTTKRATAEKQAEMGNGDSMDAKTKEEEEEEEGEEGGGNGTFELADVGEGDADGEAEEEGATTTTTSTAESSATVDEESEGQTKSTRAAEQEEMPDPGHVADPSLVPIHLHRPDYRPLVTTGQPELPPPTPETTASEGASSTVANMGGEGPATASTIEPATTEAPATEGEAAAAEAAEGQAEAKEEEAEAAAGEASKKEEEAQAAQATATETRTEAENAHAEAAEKQAEAAQAEAEAEEAKEAEEQAEQAEAAKNAQAAGQEVAETIGKTEGQAEAGAEEPKEEEGKEGEGEEEGKKDPLELLTEALESARLLVQNITLVLPGDNPSLRAFLAALLEGGGAVRQLQMQPEAEAESASSTSPAPPPLPPFTPLPPPTPSSLQIPMTLPVPAPYPFYDPLSATRMGMPPNAYAAPAPQQPQPSFLVDVEQLHSWMKSGENVKLLDASYEPELTSDHIRFYNEYYGKWNKLMLEKTSRQYERSHIAGAISFNLNIATYPSWNERQALYPPERFEEYVQRLGIDRGDRVVIYARGPLSGMLHAARAWFLFRVYGHDNVCVLNGGMDAWRRADLPATDSPVQSAGLGNWKANFRSDLVVTFEELTARNPAGHCLLSRIYWYNFLDARPRNEFFGVAGGAQQTGRLAGTKTFPADELIQANGLLLPPMEIMQKLQQTGYSRQSQTVVMGNTADEASLALLALAQVQDTSARLYNGGMDEIRRRAPYLVTAGRGWQRK